jgi:peptidoglycan-associated lipoprotein
MRLDHLLLGITASLVLAAGCARAKDAQPTTPTASRRAPPVEVAQPAAPAPIEERIVARPSLEPIYFDFDKSIILSDDVDKLRTLGAYLVEHPEKSVIIGGHCDERGTVEYNIALGERRAQAARDFLLRLGVEANRVRTISYGESMPVDPGQGEEAWAKNRRDEFQLEEKRAQR